MPLLYCLFFLEKQNLIYFPTDILNLFQLYHSSNSQIPHNTLVSDPLFQFEPWRHYVKEQFLNGQFPLWNNLNSKGVPLFANGQSAVLFPLNILYYILPVSIALNLIPAIKILLLICFSYLYLRSIRMSKEVSILGSMLIFFSGFPMVWLLWPHTNTYIFLPLFLFIIEKIATHSENSHRWYFLLSISFCFAIFGGHYETLLHILFIYTFYILFRVGYNLRILTKMAVFTLLGFLLSSIQLFPFLEYFLNSYARIYRVHTSGFYLPIESSILNIFPFIMGAPHVQFYRPISSITNFQESVGGYIGLISIFISFVGGTFLFKKSEIKFWVFCTVFFWLLAFKIWPVGFILELPLLSQVQNSRISSIAAFSAVMIIILSIENYKFILKRILNKKRVISFFAFILFLIFAVLVLAIPSIFKINHPFIPFLKDHLIFIAFTTFSFLIIALYFFDKLGKKGVSLIVLLFSGVQTFLLFVTYIPFLSKNDFYPRNRLIERLSKEKLTVLEVGNPSIVPNINLMYGISSAQNYDALEIKSYKEAFDKAFPVKNHWNKVDKVELKSLNKFGIDYILSDYNLNDHYQKAQPKVTSIIGPLIKNLEIDLYFKPDKKILSGIRILTANYNRKNSCTVNLEILQSQNKDLIYKKSIPCYMLLDKMFYTIKVPDIYLNQKNEYVLRLTSNTVKENAIGLWGENNKPFVELLYATQSKHIYKLLDSHNGVNLFKVPDSQDIQIDGNYRLLNETSSSLLIEYNSRRDSDIEIKKVYYPGWKATIDSKIVGIGMKDPFMSIKTSKGNHILKLTYEPASFLVGSIVSFVTTFALLIYLLRNELKMKWWNILSKQYFKKIEEFLQKGDLTSLLIIPIFILIAIIFSFGLTILIPNNLQHGYVSTINWMTVNKHSLSRDYIIFGIFAVLIPLSIILGWIFILWKKK